MSEKSQTYLEEQLEAVVETDHQSLTILFQREKLKLMLLRNWNCSRQWNQL